jgi:hypothetical protein
VPQGRRRTGKASRSATPTRPLRVCLSAEPIGRKRAKASRAVAHSRTTRCRRTEPIGKRGLRK